MSADEHVVLHRLQSEVEAELRMFQSDPPADLPTFSPAEWMVDPGEVERLRIGLYGILGAVRALEADQQSAYAIENAVRGLDPTP